MIALRIAAAFAVLGLASAGFAAPVVATRDGPVTGVTSDGVDRYLAIPYAAPPLGDLRWRAPQPVQRWTRPRDGSAFGAWCMQVAAPGFSLPSQSEDCLTLNVMAPHHSHAGERRPVMVWIHGGGMRQGRANDYDPALLDGKGVVFVSFNYRLNAMGFLAARSFAGQAGGAANFGLMDQQAVLRWVHANIARFGGDPGNVTLFGESSGGANVFAHLVSPASRGLFARAIVDSGALWYGPFAAFYNGLPRNTAEATADRVATLLGCTGDVPACLRAAPIDKLMDAVRAIPTYAFGLEVDGTVLPTTLRDAIDSGRFARVPIIDGANQDEWTWVEGLEENAAGHPLRTSELRDHLAENIGDAAPAAVLRYPPSVFGGSPGLASAHAVTDGLFRCPMLALNAVLARYTPVYGFEFDDIHAPVPFRPASFAYGAAHTLELRYLFRNWHGAIGTIQSMSPDQQRLSDTMVAYWTNFARTGRPYASGAPRWPALAPTYPTGYMTLHTPEPSLVPAALLDVEAQCTAFWNRIETPFTNP